MKNLFKVIVVILIVFLVGCKKEPNIVPTDEEKEPEKTELEIKLEEKDIIFSWLESEYKNTIIKSDVVFPKKHPDYDLEIEVISFDEEYLDSEGNYNAPIINYKTEILFVIEIEKVEYELYVPIIILGKGDVFDAIEAEINELVPEVLESNVVLPKTVFGFDCEIEWSSSDENYLKNDGSITKDIKSDKYVVLTYTVTVGGIKRDFSRIAIVKKLSDLEKINLTKEYLDEVFKDYGKIDKNIELPYKYDEYNTYIGWQSWNPTVVSDYGKYNRPFIDEEVMLEATIGSGSKFLKYRFNFVAEGENNKDVWEKIESFLERINKKEITNQKFYLYGSEVGYYKVPTQNIGYLPFYDEEEMTIIESILPDNSKLKPNRERKATKYIVIHNTGMAHPTANASNLNSYIHSTDRVASWHFSIDDKETYQQLKLNEVGWHAGDGSRSYLEPWSGGIGGGNENGIGIESCVYDGVDFNMVMRRLAKLVASLMVTYDLDMQSIKQHYDFSGKDCPQVIRSAGRWRELLDLIRLEYFARTELNGVSFEWTSLNPDIMDNEGRVINHPKEETEISYKVKVTYNGESKEFTYTSKLLKLEE